MRKLYRVFNKILKDTHIRDSQQIKMILPSFDISQLDRDGVYESEFNLVTVVDLEGEIGLRCAELKLEDERNADT